MLESDQMMSPFHGSVPADAGEPARSKTPETFEIALPTEVPFVRYIWASWEPKNRFSTKDMLKRTTYRSRFISGYPGNDAVPPPAPPPNKKRKDPK